MTAYQNATANVKASAATKVKQSQASGEKEQEASPRPDARTVSASWSLTSLDLNSSNHTGLDLVR
jgi:hypothetical protein